MHLVPLPLATLLAVAFVGCRPRPQQSLVQDDVAAQAAGATHIGDAPPVGRSAFDYFVADNGGVPFPFEALLAALAQKVPVKPDAVLIPHGRSLAKLATDLAEPRILIKSPTAVGPSTCFQGDNAEIRSGIVSTIFVGYAEKARSLEVISYNAQAARMEFQVVRDYESGKTPKVFYASRALCTSCHQSEGLAFSRFPWTETNEFRSGAGAAFANVPKALIDAHSGQKSYHDVRLSQTGNSIATGDKVRITAERFELGAHAVDRLLFAQKVWLDGCGPDPAKAVECRILALKLAAGQLLGVKPGTALNVDRASEEYTRLHSSWMSHWPAVGIPVAGSLVANRDVADVESLRPEKPLSAAENPLTPKVVTRAFPSMIADEEFGTFAVAGPFLLRERLTTPNALILVLAKELMTPFATRFEELDADRPKLFKAFESPRMRPLVEAARFDAFALASALIEELGGAPIPDECYASSNGLADPVTLNGGSTLVENSADVPTKTVTLLRQYEALFCFGFA